MYLNCETISSSKFEIYHKNFGITQFSSSIKKSNFGSEGQKQDFKVCDKIYLERDSVIDSDRLPNNR
jgi:hypothetical protein